MISAKLLKVPHRLLRASAGVGKTYQLVEVYVDLLLNYDLLPAEILVLTFTRKAAAELRTRIWQKLQTQGVAKSLLSKLVFAPIDNFHGLAVKLLREFAFKGGPSRLDRAPEEQLPWLTKLTELRILGQAGADQQLFTEACYDTWFVKDSLLSAAVEQAALYFPLDQGFIADLWQVIARAREDGQFLELGDPLAPQKIMQRLFGSYDPGRLKIELAAEFTRLREEICARYLDNQEVKLTPLARESLRSFQETPLPAGELTDVAWAESWELLGSKLNWRTNLRELFTKAEQVEIKNTWSAKPYQLLAEREASELVENLSLLTSAAFKAYQEAKIIAGVGDFGDLVESLVQLLNSDKNFYQTLRERFKAVLVDEAQDTNFLQTKLIRLLAGLAEEPELVRTAAARLWLVGDAKQAIYTFRGADPTSFQTFVEEIKTLGGVEEYLQISRRSTPSLLQGINSLAQSIFGEAYVSEALLPVDEAPPASFKAMTYLQVMAAAPVDSESPLGESKQILLEAEALALWLRAKLEEETPSFRVGDTALLLAHMTHASLYATILREYGIPVRIGGGSGFYEQQEIWDVLALLSWLVDPTDYLSLAIFGRSALAKLSLSGLVAIFSGDTLNFIQHWLAGKVELTAQAQSLLAPDDQLKLETLAPKLAELFQLVQRESVVEVLERLDILFDLQTVYGSLKLGAQRVANLEKLLELARDFALEDLGTTSRFVYLQTRKLKQNFNEPLAPLAAASATSEPLTISSVHQAKGLQYKIVIIGDLTNKGRGETAQVRYYREPTKQVGEIVFCWSQRESAEKKLTTARWQKALTALNTQAWLEKQRLLYVAITRAEEQVILIGRQLLDEQQQYLTNCSTAGFAEFIEPWLAVGLTAGVLELTSVMVGRGRIERPTNGLKVRCSTG